MASWLKGFREWIPKRCFEMRNKEISINTYGNVFITKNISVPVFYSVGEDEIISGETWDKCIKRFWDDENNGW